MQTAIIDIAVPGALVVISYANLAYQVYSKNKYIKVFRKSMDAAFEDRPELEVLTEHLCETMKNSSVIYNPAFEFFKSPFQAMQMQSMLISQATAYLVVNNMDISAILNMYDKLNNAQEQYERAVTKSELREAYANLVLTTCEISKVINESMVEKS